MKRITAAILASFLCLWAVACSQQTVADLIKLAGNTAAQVASLEGLPQVAQAISKDSAQAATLALNWKSGQPTDNIIAVVNTISSDIDQIPGASRYAPLIDLAVATLDTVLTSLNKNASPAVQARVHLRVTLTPGATSASGYRKAFRAIQAAHPETAEVHLP